MSPGAPGDLSPGGNGGYAHARIILQPPPLVLGAGG